MEALYLLIPLSTLLVFLAIWVFFRASDGGQFDDLEGPALRILHDDDGVAVSASASASASDEVGPVR